MKKPLREAYLRPIRWAAALGANFITQPVMEQAAGGNSMAGQATGMLAGSLLAKLYLSPIEVNETPPTPEKVRGMPQYWQVRWR